MLPGGKTATPEDNARFAANMALMPSKATTQVFPSLILLTLGKLNPLPRNRLGWTKQWRIPPTQIGAKQKPTHIARTGDTPHHNASTIHTAGTSFYVNQLGLVTRLSS